MAINDIKTLNTLKEVDDYRKLINESLDERAEFIKTCCKADEISKKDFGYKKACFENISTELFKTNEGKKLINKYTNTIKSSKNLSALHSIYENIRKAGSNGDVDYFVNTIANEDWGVDKNTVNEDNYKLGKIVAEGFILVGGKGELPKENTELSSAVKFISENKKTKKNIAEYSSAVMAIRNAVMENENGVSLSESKDIDSIANELIENFNKKYTSELSESEISALKEICESDNRENIFNKYKKSCEEKLSIAKENFVKENNTSAAERIDTIIEQVSNKKYSLDTIGSDICGMIKLSSVFE